MAYLGTMRVVGENLIRQQARLRAIRLGAQFDKYLSCVLDVQYFAGKAYCLP